MAKSTDFDKTHRRNLAAIGTRIDRIFKKATEEAAKIGVNIKSPLPEDRIFSFDDYPETEKQIKRLLAALQDSMDVVIANGVRSGWNLANNKNDALCHRVFGDNVGKLTKEQYKRYFSTNGEALDAFLQRKTNGLNLSDRVWRYTQSFKREIEMGLDLGIRTGSPSAKMARDLKQYLQHPDKLFRRVRDKHGILRLSQEAREFHPGRGVYRSSYKNALRLAITETNIAYHTADHLRWQQMDFVVGIEIRLSGNHTIENAKGQAIRLTDICDELAGKYPKDFKFVGWHPHCRCQAISILKTEKEMEEDTQRILDGKAPTKDSVNAVEGVPAAFSDWVEAHSDRIVQGGNLPYFLRDNKRRVDAILGMSDNPNVERIQTDWNQSRSSNVLIEHLQKFGDLEGHYGGKLDESSAYKHWERLTTEQRLNVLAKGRFTGMLSSEEDLDFCNLYLKSDKEVMTGILQEKLENVRYGYNMEDENHYVFHFKNGKKIFFSEDLDKPLSKRDLERLDWVSANSGLSNYRYWCVDEKAKADMMQQMGFIEYRNGHIVASWNGKDYLGNEIEDKYIGQGIIEKGKDFIISKRFARLNTHDEVATTLSELLGKRLGYEVEVDVNKDLIDLATAKGYATELERLSRQYMLKQESLSKVVLGYTPSEPMEFGSVFYNPKESTKKTLSLRKALEERFPDKAINSSRCERKHITRSIATHEFGHLLYQFREEVPKQNILFESELQRIFYEYRQNVKALIKEDNMEGLAKIFIGKYGNDRLSEFMAEAFQEYKNCRHPSKYALEIGKLIDTWYKK